MISVRRQFAESASVLIVVIMSVGATKLRAAEIQINNLDGPGEGFNDPTPFTPVGSNPATTIGEARRIAFQHAALLWGRCLASNVVIQVDARFDTDAEFQANFGTPACTATGAVLGGARANTRHFGFMNAVANTLYPQALANARHNGGGATAFDLAPTDADIVATFNSSVDGPICLGGTDWYYGLDSTPSGTNIDFVTTVLHEIGHGLGFATFMNGTTGALSMGMPDVFLRNLERHGATPSALDAMTNAQRVAANTSGPDLHWIGANVVAASGTLTAGAHPSGHVQMFAPNPFMPGSSVSHFDTALTPNEIMEPFATGANHSVGLALPLFQDLGWTILQKNGTDVVFLMDLTGSTGALLPDWVLRIPDIVDVWLARDQNARFAIASHVDFPFAPHGQPGEFAYRVELGFLPPGTPRATVIANLTAALMNLTNRVGGDAPESQYEAIFQVLTGKGRDLSLPLGNLNDPGEIPATPLGQLFPMVIYHFTFPQICTIVGCPPDVCFHDQSCEPNYPFAGSLPIAGRSEVLAEMASRRSFNMFFGLTFVPGGGPIPALEQGDGNGGGESPFGEITNGPLAELADLTGGRVYNVGSGTNNLEFLIQAIKASIGVWTSSPQANPDDEDGDGITRGDDNCPTLRNRDQRDTDGDGIGDICDNCPQKANSSQIDRDFDGLGAACDTDEFHRSDADGSGRLDITDAVFTLNYLFAGGPAPGCLDAADSDDDGELIITDPIFTLTFLFLGGEAPPDPGSTRSACGPDPTLDKLPCELYASCN